MKTAGELSLKAIIKGWIKNSACRLGGAERPHSGPGTLTFASHLLNGLENAVASSAGKAVSPGFVASVGSRLDDKQNDEGALKSLEQWFLNF